MIDPHRVRNVEAVLHVHLDAEFPLGQRGLDHMGAHLHQHQSRQPGSGTPFGYFGKASYLLQQFQHSDFRGHNQFLSRVLARHVPSRICLARFCAAKESRRGAEIGARRVGCKAIPPEPFICLRKCRLAAPAGFG
jgi:hypothetical protein